MDLQLTGKKALVCAASKGLGKAIATVLAEEGADLFLCSRTEGPLAETAKQLQQKFAGRDIRYVACDLSTASGVLKLIETVQKEWGPIEILINNVGGPPPSSAKDTTAEQWRQGFEQIFMSSQQLTHHFLPPMLERQFGRIITITSLSVVEPIPHLAVSTAMRAAVTAFHKNLATEVASCNVTVHTVMPGVIHTGRVEKLREAKAARDGTSLSEEMDKTRANIPAGRLGDPMEFARTVGFLASPAASYLNGLNLPVDGGLRRGWT